MMSIIYLTNRSELSMIFSCHNHMLHCVKIILFSLTNFLYKDEPIILLFVILIRFLNYNGKGEIKYIAPLIK